MSLWKMGAADIAAGVRGGDISATEVIAAHLDRVQEANPRLNAFTDITADRARQEAAAIDAKRQAGETLPPLAGVPFAVKNLFDVAGLPTRAGSRINRDAAPAAGDAVLIERLSAAGAVLTGALNMGEYAYDFTGENAHDGACRNPHDPERMSGGSSSGSAASVAGELVPLSLGSDTNGSIRVPASLCGIFGLKPTYGRLSRRGTFPFCDSLDHLGPFARSVRDLTMAFDALQGPDADDPACATVPAVEAGASLDRGAEGLRVAVAGGYFATETMPEAAAAVEAAASALGARQTIEIPHALEGRAAAYIITNAESSAFHLERLRRRADDYDPETRDRFLAGALLPAAWLVRAQRVRRWYHDQVIPLFDDVDVILAPATPCTAPKLGEKVLTVNGQEVPLRPHLGLFTQPISAIGLPVVAAPTGPESGLPIGIQIIAAPWREDLCLRIAGELEKAGVARCHAAPA